MPELPFFYFSSIICFFNKYNLFSIRAELWMIINGAAVSNSIDHIRNMNVSRNRDDFLCLYYLLRHMVRPPTSVCKDLADKKQDARCKRQQEKTKPRFFGRFAPSE